MAPVEVNLGILALGAVAFGFPAVVAILDLWFLRQGDRRPRVGELIQVWSKRYPVFALAFAMVMGLLVGHFFWSTPGECRITTANAPAVQLPENDRDCRPPSQPKD